MNTSRTSHVDYNLLKIKRCNNKVRLAFRSTDGEYNYYGDAQVFSFDPWGNRRDFQNWSAPIATTNFLFDRGFTGHQMLDEFCIIDMNGRIYDPVIARFFSPDPFIQLPTNTQSFNRYSYVMNNPLRYTDPSGEFIWVPMAVAAFVGTYIGGSIANSSSNPADWNFRSGKTWGYMLAGGIVGGVSGYMGGVVAASGMPMANTAAIASGSFINSVGTNIYTGGQTDVSIAFGVGSYNMNRNELRGLWNWGDLNTREKIGYSLGALGNLNDINNLINKTNAIIYTQERYKNGAKDIITHRYCKR
jgi:RHS repeat-associated protein